MKELGEYLKTTRVSNGVSISEAAEDLDLSISQIENIESGNVRAFKDVYGLKQYVGQYAKYLGLDCDSVLDEFNGFLFEHTSKISLDDVKAAQKSNDANNKKIQSPYTKEYKVKMVKWPFVLGFCIIIVMMLLIYILYVTANKTPERSSELRRMEVVYEFTY